MGGWMIEIRCRVSVEWLTDNRKKRSAFDRCFFWVFSGKLSFYRRGVSLRSRWMGWDGCVYGRHDGKERRMETTSHDSQLALIHDSPCRGSFSFCQARPDVVGPRSRALSSGFLPAF